MKTTFALVLVVALNALAEVPQQVIEGPRGPNHHEWRRIVTTTNELDEILVRTNLAYVELESGLHFQDEQGNWQRSSEEIELLGDGAVARKGRHQVIFSPNLNTSGAIELLTPDNKRLRSHILGLAYLDQAGQSVLIAEVKDSIGQLLPPNQVIYEDAFTDFRADVRFTYTKAGFEQDVILRERPPPCTEWGLDPNSSALLLLTEFVEAPVAPDLDFGEMKIGSGKAFSVPDAGPEGDSVPVRRSRQTLEGRDVLIEEVNVERIESQLQALPAAQGAALRPNRRTPQPLDRLAAALPFPPRRTAKRSDPMQMAKADFNQRRGFNIDYILLSTSDLLLKSDTTYLVMGAVTLSSLKIEGGTCVKLSNSPNAKITVSGTLDCQTSSFRPGVFTSWQDCSVGEAIPSSTCALPDSGSYHGHGLTINSSGQTVKDLRFSYVGSGVTLGFEEGQINLANLQFVKCQYPIDSSGNDLNLIVADNCLFYSSGYVVKGGRDLTVYGQHWTVNECTKLGSRGIGSGIGLGFLTNCVLVAMSSGYGNWDDDVVTNQVAKFDSDTGVFSQVGAAKHYLASDTYRGIGASASITPALMDELKQKTTRPPEIITSISQGSIVGPREIGDSFTGGKGDLGFHYPILDYVTSGLTLANTLVLSNGISLGVHGASTSYGIQINPGGKLISEGLPMRLNRIVRYNTVQEQAVADWSSSSVAPAVKITSTTSPLPEARFRFTQWSVLAANGDHVYASSSPSVGTHFQDCQFGGGSFYSKKTYLGVTNCLWERVYLTVDDQNSTTDRRFYNNLFRRGTFDMTVKNEGTWLLYDNFFDQTNFSGEQDGSTANYNAYVTNCTRLYPNGANDKVLTNSPIYSSSTLGKYYYPTADGMLSLLSNAGSRSASDAGLHHFTTVASQTKDSSTVDIGFHFVALASGIPADADGDALPDYQEDRNGNGFYNSGSETDWQTSENGTTSGAGMLQVFTVLE